MPIQPADIAQASVAFVVEDAHIARIRAAGEVVGAPDVVADEAVAETTFVGVEEENDE